MAKISAHVSLRLLLLGRHRFFAGNASALTISGSGVCSAFAWGLPTLRFMAGGCHATRGVRATISPGVGGRIAGPARSFSGGGADRAAAMRQDNAGPSAWNKSQLGQSLDVTHATIGHHLDMLAQTYMVRTLPPLLPNLKKRLVKSPKIYVRDSGLLHTLLGLETEYRPPRPPGLRRILGGFCAGTSASGLPGMEGEPLPHRDWGGA